MQTTKEVIIFTDGACSGNPGPGGWGAVIYTGNKVDELSGFEINTTNNRMEVTAAIKALESIEKPAIISLHTDSNYLKLGITVWILSWKRNNWKNKNKKVIKNVDLWKKLDQLNYMHKITWNWVKAHAGHPDNERADTLATDAIKKRLG